MATTTHGREEHDRSSIRSRMRRIAPTLTIAAPYRAWRRIRRQPDQERGVERGPNRISWSRPLRRLQRRRSCAPGEELRLALERPSSVEEGSLTSPRSAYSIRSALVTLARPARAIRSQADKPVQQEADSKKTPAKPPSVYLTHLSRPRRKGFPTISFAKFLKIHSTTVDF